MLLNQTSTTNGQHDHLIVSIDTFHKPSSTIEERDDADHSQNPLQLYIFREGKLTKETASQIMMVNQDEGTGSSNDASGRLANLLYGLENLRKREGDTQED